MDKAIGINQTTLGLINGKDQQPILSSPLYLPTIYFVDENNGSFSIFNILVGSSFVIEKSHLLPIDLLQKSILYGNNFCIEVLINRLRVCIQTQKKELEAIAHSLFPSYSDPYEESWNSFLEIAKTQNSLLISQDYRTWIENQKQSFVENWKQYLHHTEQELLLRYISHINFEWIGYSVPFILDTSVKDFMNPKPSKDRTLFFM